MEKEDQNARVVNRNGKWVALDANGDTLGTGATRSEAAKYLAAKNNA
jgi:ribosomal protein L13